MHKDRKVAATREDSTYMNKRGIGYTLTATTSVAEGEAILRRA